MSPPEQQSVSGWHRWRSRFWGLGVAGVWFAFAIGWTVRDSVPFLTLVYYAMPPVVIGVIALVVAWLGRKGRGTFFGTGSSIANRSTAALGMVCLVQWTLEDFRLGSNGEPPPTSLKLAFWNVGRGHLASWERIAGQIRLLDADVVALAEATDEQTLTREFWADNLPGYTAIRLKAGLIVLAKGNMTQHFSQRLGSTGEFRHISLDIRDTAFDLILTDIESHPFKSRQAPLDRLFELVQQQSTIPTLVAGDFNTPPKSVWFDRWRSDWTRAWEVAGTGYQPTWPLPFPVLTLDHVWGNRKVTFHRSAPGWTLCSDHRPIVVHFSMPHED